jgi:hypothetical protein
MKFFGKAADKVLSYVVPGLTAGACCVGSGTSSTVSCNECAGNGIGLAKKCTVTCFCQLSCGACNIKIASSGCR